MFFFLLLGLDCLQLKTILVPNWHKLGWHLLLPLTFHRAVVAQRLSYPRCGFPSRTLWEWQFLQKFPNLILKLWHEHPDLGGIAQGNHTGELRRMCPPSSPPAAVSNQQNEWSRARMLVPKGWKAGLSRGTENFWLAWYESSFQKWWKQAHIVLALGNLILFQEIPRKKTR